MHANTNAKAAGTPSADRVTIWDGDGGSGSPLWVLKRDRPWARRQPVGRPEGRTRAVPALFGSSPGMLAG